MIFFLFIIINISKIKDSFFIGDKISGTNLDVLIQFKISHIINTAGTEILNYFETENHNTLHM